jgi:hypothetical protein
MQQKHYPDSQTQEACRRSPRNHASIHTLKGPEAYLFALIHDDPSSDESRSITSRSNTPDPETDKYVALEKELPRQPVVKKESATGCLGAVNFGSQFAPTVNFFNFAPSNIKLSMVKSRRIYR